LTGYIVRIALTEFDTLILDMLTLCVAVHWRGRLHAIDARAGTGCNAENYNGQQQQNAWNARVHVERSSSLLRSRPFADAAMCGDNGEERFKAVVTDPLM
jgi:hypothetical protein